jgi:hypothetical protein
VWVDFLGAAARALAGRDASASASLRSRDSSAKFLSGWIREIEGADTAAGGLPGGVDMGAEEERLELAALEPLCEAGPAFFGRQRGVRIGLPTSAGVLRLVFPFP